MKKISQYTSRLLMLLVLALCQMTAYADQDIIINVSPKQYYLPPQAGLYFTDPGRFFNVSLTNRDPYRPQTVFLGVTLRLPISHSVEGGLLATSQALMPDRFIVVPPGETKALTELELTELFNQYTASLHLIKEGRLGEIFDEQSAGGACLLPEGQYELHLQAYYYPSRPNSYELASVFTSGRCYFHICYKADPPQFIQPFDPQTLSLTLSMEEDLKLDSANFMAVDFPVNNPHFAWSKPQGHCSNWGLSGVVYDFRLKQLFNYQTIDEALQFNAVVFQQLGLMTPYLDLSPQLVSTLCENYSGNYLIAEVTARPIDNDPSSELFNSITNQGRSRPLLLQLPSKEELENPHEVYVKVKARMNLMPAYAATYFVHPEELIDVSMTNKSNRDIKVVCSMNVYPRGGDERCFSTQLTNRTPILLHPYESYHLSKEEAHQMFGELKSFRRNNDRVGSLWELDPIFAISNEAHNSEPIWMEMLVYDYDKLLKAKESGQTKVFEDLLCGSADLSGVTTDNGNPVLAQIEPRLEVLTHKYETYLKSPGQLFRITLENKLDIAHDVLPMLTFKTFNGEYFQGDYSGRMSEAITLAPHERRELTIEEINHLCGGFESYLIFKDLDKATDKKVVVLNDNDPKQAFPLDAEWAAIVRLRVADISSQREVGETQVLYNRGLCATAFSDFEYGRFTIGDVVGRVDKVSENDDYPIKVSNYIDYPDRLFKVTIENTSERERRVIPKLLYHLVPDDYFYPKYGNVDEVLANAILLKSGEKVTLTKEQMKLFFTHPRSVDLMKEDGSETDCPDYRTRLADPESDPYAVLEIYDADILEKNRTNEQKENYLISTSAVSFQIDPDVILGDIKIDLKAKSDEMPCAISNYFDMPERLWEISFTNEGDEVQSFIPWVAYYFSGFDGNAFFHRNQDFEEMKNALITLQPGQTYSLGAPAIKVFFGHNNRPICLGEDKEYTLEQLQTLYARDNELSVITVRLLSVNLERALKEQGIDRTHENVTIGLETVQFSTFYNTKLGNVEGKVESLVPVTPNQPELLLKDPGQFFGITLKNISSHDETVRLRLSYNDEFYAESLDVERCISVPAQTEIKLTPEQVNQCLGNYTKEDTKNIVRGEWSIEKELRRVKLKQGYNGLALLLMPPTSMDTISVSTGSFTTKMQELQIGEFKLEVKDISPVPGKKDTFAGYGAVKWSPFGDEHVIPIECSFDSIQIADGEKVTSGCVRTRRSEMVDDQFDKWFSQQDQVLAFSSATGFDAQFTPITGDTLQYESGSSTAGTAELKQLLRDSGFANFYRHVKGDMKSLTDIATLLETDGQKAITLPLRMPTTLLSAGQCPVDLQIYSMEFTPEAAFFSILGEYAMPETDYTKSAEDLLVLGALNLELHPNSFLPQSGKVALMADFTVKDPTSGFSMTFCGPTDRKKIEDGCFVAWDQNGFGGLSVSARMEIPGIQKATPEGVLMKGQKPEIKLQAVINDASDWYGSVMMDPFQLKEAPGYTFIPSGTKAGIVYDHSNRRTPQGITFPSTKDKKYSLVNAGFTSMNDWQGFYFEELGCRFPDYIKVKNKGGKSAGNDNLMESNDDGLVVKMKNLTIDRSGFSSSFMAYNIIDVETGDLGGWAFSLDTLQLTIVQNDFAHFGFSGEVEVPLLEGAIGYSANVVQVDKSENSDEFGTIVNFKTQQVKDLKLDFFLATADFNRDETFFQVKAGSDIDTKVDLNLGGNITINGTKDLDLPLDLKIPGLEFHRMYLANYPNQLTADQLKEIEADSQLSGLEAYSKFMGEGLNLYRYTSDDFCFDLGRWRLTSFAKDNKDNQAGQSASSTQSAATTPTQSAATTPTSPAAASSAQSTTPATPSSTPTKLATADLGPFELSLDDIRIANKGTQLGLRIGGSIGVMEMIDAGAAVTIWADIDLERKKAKYSSVAFDSAYFDCNLGGLEIGGGLSVKDDATFKGYAGDLRFKLPGNFLTFEASGGYFEQNKTEEDKAIDIKQGRLKEAERDTYAWGYFDFKAGSKLMAGLPPVGITGFGGGFYINSTANKTASYRTYGGRFNIGLSVGSENLLNGNFDATLFYDAAKQRLSSFRFDGKAHALTGQDLDKGLLNADMTLVYDHTGDEKNLDMLLTADATIDDPKIFAQLTGVPLPEIGRDIADLQEEFGEKGNTVPLAKTETGNLKFNCGAKMDLKLHVGMKSPTVPNPKWYLWLGDPTTWDKRCRFTLIDFQAGEKTDMFAIWAKMYANGYLCLGNQLPVNPITGEEGGLPTIDPEVAEFLDGKGLDGESQSGQSARAEQGRENPISKSGIDGGVMFGAAFGGEFGMNAGVAYCDVSAIGGFDLSVKKLKPGARCLNSTAEAGKNGWYAQGQVYGLLKGDIGLMVDLWLYKGKVSICDMGLGALMQGGFPNPAWMLGKARAKVKLFNGLIKFDQSINLKCGNVCIPDAGNPLDDLQVFGDVFPGSELKEEGWSAENRISPYAVPRFTTNMEMDRRLDLIDENIINTNPKATPQRTYVFHLGKSYLDAYGSASASNAAWSHLMQGTDYLSNDHVNYTLNSGSLAPDTCYSLRLSAFAKEVVNGREVDPVFNDKESGYKDVNRPWSTEKVYYFRTGNLPPTIAPEDVASVVPASVSPGAMLFWNEAERPYVSMKRSRKDILYPDDADYSVVGRLEYRWNNEWRVLGEIPYGEATTVPSYGKKFIELAPLYRTDKFELPSEFSSLPFNSAGTLRFSVLRINNTAKENYLKDSRRKVERKARFAKGQGLSQSSTARNNSENGFDLESYMKEMGNESLREQTTNAYMEQEVHKFEQQIDMNDYVKVLYQATFRVKSAKTFTEYMTWLKDGNKLDPATDLGLYGSSIGYVHFQKITEGTSASGYADLMNSNVTGKDNTWLRPEVAYCNPYTTIGYWAHYGFIGGYELPKNKATGRTITSAWSVDMDMLKYYRYRPYYSKVSSLGAATLINRSTSSDKINMLKNDLRPYLDAAQGYNTQFNYTWSHWPSAYNHARKVLMGDAYAVENFTSNMMAANKTYMDKAITRYGDDYTIDWDASVSWSRFLTDNQVIINSAPGPQAAPDAAFHMQYLIQSPAYQVPFAWSIWYNRTNDDLWAAEHPTRNDKEEAWEVIQAMKNRKFEAKRWLRGIQKMRFFFYRPTGWNVDNTNGQDVGFDMHGSSSNNVFYYDIQTPFKDL